MQVKKRKLFQALAEGPDEHAERVLRADRADLNLKKVADLRRRDLGWSELNEAFLSVCSCCCVVMPGKELSSDEHRLLDRFSVAVFPWKPSLDYFVDVLRRKDIIWLTNDDEVEIIRGEVRDDAPPDSQTGFLIAWTSSEERVKRCNLFYNLAAQYPLPVSWSATNRFQLLHSFVRS